MLRPEPDQAASQRVNQEQKHARDVCGVYLLWAACPPRRQTGRLLPAAADMNNPAAPERSTKS